MSEVLEQTQQWSEDAFILMREITMAYKDLQGIQRRGRRNFTFEAKIAAEIQARGLEISTLTTAQIQSREALISSIVSSLRGTPESNTQETRDAIKSVTEEAQRSTISEEIKKAINRVVEVSDNRDPLPVETQETKALKPLSIQELTYLTDARNPDIVQRISAYMVLARKLQAARAGDSAVLVYRDLIDILEELEESPEITERILKTKGKLRTTEVKLARIKRTPIDTEAAAKPFLVVMEDENQTNAMRHIAAVALCGIYSNANEPEKVVEFQKRVMEFARTKREIDIAAKEMNRKPPEFQDLIAQHANALKRLQTVKNTGTLEEALKILREMENLETEIRPAGTPSELTINGIQTFKTCIRIKNHTLNPESEEIAPSELPHIAKRLERA